MMNRVQRRGPISSVLLVLAMTACGGSSPDGASAPERTAGGSPSGARPSAGGTENGAPARTVLLHVSGMMKSKSGAT
jgi:hypothetical protein